MFLAICRKIKKLARRFSNNTIDAIDAGDKWGIISAALCLLLSAFGVIGLIAGVTFLLVSNAKFLFTWVALPVFTGWVLVYWLTSSKPEETGDVEEDPIEEELALERARDISPRMEELGYLAIQEASSNTPLVRPRSISDVQSSAARHDHFHMVKVDDGTKKTSIAIFQIECELDTPLEEAQKNSLRETIQRCVTKQSIRFPDLTDYGAKGGPAIEVLDPIPLGDYVVIELVQRTAASIPLIDARHRVRAEKRRKQQTYIDADYTE